MSGWKLDWSDFSNFVNEQFQAGKPREELSAVLAGESIEWEGVLAEKHLERLSPSVTIGLSSTQFILSDGSTSVPVRRLGLPIAEDSIDAWSAIPEGSDVRFRARFAQPRAVFPALQIVPIEDDRVCIIISLKVGRPVVAV